MRVNKFLALAGVASRRNCDKLIKDGLVEVNGKTCKMGMEIDEYTDHVYYEGRRIKLNFNFEYYIINKPKGCVTTVKDELNRKTVMDFIPSSSRLFPVGRLDYDSEGLLIITNDGDLCNRLTHPSNEIPKTYLVKIEGTLEPQVIAKLSKGVEIDGKMTKKCKIAIVDEDKEFTKYHVTVTEGRNREIRKMFEVVGKEVIFLKRIKIGDLSLGGLSRGEYRKLNNQEINYLKNL